MEQWITSRDTKLAAAFGTLGMPIRIKNTFDEKSGTEIVRFQIGLMNVEGNLKTNRLRACLKNGSLEAKEPGHPLLTILRTFRSRELILDLANKGIFCELREVIGAKGVWQYLPSPNGLPGVQRGQAVIKTGDLKMVAALGTAGLRLLKIEGVEGERCFWLEAFSMSGLSGVDLMHAWRRDKESVPWSMPFAQSARGLYNRERLLDAVNRCERHILLRKGKGVRSAVISEHASEVAWDEVSDFFGG